MINLPPKQVLARLRSKSRVKHYELIPHPVKGQPPIKVYKDATNNT